MRIDLNASVANQVSPDKNAKQVKENQGARDTETHGVRATLSSDTTTVGALVAKAMQTPAVRQDKVDALRESIKQGSYQIDPGEIAEAILKEQGK